MNPVDAGFKELGVEDRAQLQAWLAEFERGWQGDALPARVGALPPAGALRTATLLGLVKIDLRRHWQQGQRQAIESYLEAYPELGSADSVALELVQAEMQVRREVGETVAWADYVRRFPRQMQNFQRCLDRMTGGEGELATMPPDLSGITGPTLTGPPPGTLKPSKPTAHQAVPVSPLASASGTPFGRYRLLKELGRGVMGTVYLAQDTQLHRRVALKVPHYQAGDEPDLLARFYREARAVATLEHPNICRIYDVGEVEGAPYFTMTYVEGQSLRDYQRQHSPLPTRQAVTIVYRMALALQEAHDLGVIHRDLKPSNIMMTKQGQPVIMDFGLARCGGQEERLTHQGEALGTPAYMPPEQVCGDLLVMGPGSDIYSLGVVLYELLTAQVPFRGTVASLMTRVLIELPTPPRTHCPDLDPGLEAICLKAIAKKVADRYPTMRDFAAALAPYVSTAAEDTAVCGPHTPSVVPGDTIPLTSGGTRKAFRPLRIAVGLLVVLALGILGAVLAVVLAGTPDPEPATVTLTIRSVPDGAKVYVDGQAQEKLASGTFDLPAGEHKLKVEMAGYKPLEKNVVLRVDQGSQVVDFPLERKKVVARNGEKTTPVVVPVEPMRYAVRIVSNRDGAVATVDDLPPQKTPVKLNLAAGPHKATWVLPGHATVVKDFTVIAGQAEQTVTAVLLPLVSQRFALLIGVRSPGPDLPDFVHAEPDVAELGRTLVAAGYLPKNVVVLTQSRGQKDPSAQPSPTNVRDQFEQLVRRCTPTDSLVLALVGHYVDSAGRGECSFRMTSDKAEDPSALLPLSELYDGLRECKARTKLVLLDGWRHNWVPGRKPPAPTRVCRARPELAPPPEGVAVLCSCARGQEGYEHPGERHGLFLHALLRGLQGGTAPMDKAPVTLGDLVQYVRTEVTDLAKQYYKAAQTPELLGGEPILTRPLLSLPPALVAYRRGCDHQDKGEYQEAIAALDEAARADPAYVEVYTRRAKAFFKKNNLKKALDECTKALELDPYNATAQGHKGDAYIMLKDYKLAIPCYTRAIQLDPEYADAWSDRGVGFTFKGDQERRVKDVAAAKDYELAVKDFDRAVELNPTLPRPHTNLGLLLQKQGDKDGALHELSEAAKLDPHNPMHHVRLGKIRMARKESAKAIESYNRAIQEDKRCVKAWQGRAEAHANRGDFDKAIRDYNEAIDLRPDLAELWLGRGLAYKGLGNQEEYEKHQRKANELKSGGPSP